jgi:acyl-CoA synthetase (AMP-forming)/AMP-acid ligase II
MLLHQYLEYHARARGETVFGVQNALSLTYAGANAAANQLAYAFLHLGLRAGDRFGYLSKNALDMAVMFFAASKVGAVPVPLNFRLAAQEWQFILEDCGATVVLAQSQFAAALDSVRSALPRVQHWIATDGEGAPQWQAVAVLVKGRSRDNPETLVTADAPLYQMYTSGTTGRPKGAVLTHASVVTNGYQSLAALGPLARPGERILIIMPMFHAGGASFVVGGGVAGATMVIEEDFDPKRFVDTLQRDRITAVNVVPAMLQACLTVIPDLAERQFDDLRTIVYGASPISETTLRRAIECFKCDFFQGYGQTEASAVLTFLSAADHRRALGGRPELLLSAGKPVAGTEIRVMDPDGRFLSPGELGEIVARGPQIMQGYWNMPEATAATLADGWLRTGDAGIMDEEGFVFIQDRVKDMIVSGGENIYPREIENVLFRHPAVADTAVIGVPDDKYGETPLALIVAKAGASRDPDALMQFCRENLGGYKVPRQFVFVSELPRNPSGKVLKRELREPYWKNHSRKVS